MNEASKQDLEWIINEYPKVRQLGRVTKWIDDHIKTMSIIKGHPVNKPSEQMAATYPITRTVFIILPFLFCGRIALTNALLHSISKECAPCFDGSIHYLRVKPGRPSHTPDAPR
jgi:hypothetical protein